MKCPTDLNQELQQRILNLPGVKERPNAGIHEDAFFVGRGQSKSKKEELRSRKRSKDEQGARESKKEELENRKRSKGEQGIY